MNKQTAMEQLIEALELKVMAQHIPWVQKTLDDALEMERQQIAEASDMKATIKQTAVEYIREKLLGNEYWYEGMTFDQIIDQAKEIEKEQSFAFFKAGQESMEEGGKGFEQYYNETYESNE